MAATDPKTGNTPITLGTWIFLLDQRGVRPEHPDVRDAVLALRSAGDGADYDALGAALAEQVAAGLGDRAEDPQAVVAWLSSLYGGRVEGALGRTREERLGRVRSYQFRHNLPWLACIYDRFPDGSVLPHWVLVERVQDQITCLDPYPWDDVDEEITTPVGDFLVKWELTGAVCARYVP